MLTVLSGVCWTIVYIDGIRLGFRDRSYAIPFYALAFNFAWEMLYTFFGFRRNGVTVQNVFNAIWLTFDVGILYTYFKFGLKYFQGLPQITGSTASQHAGDESGVEPGSPARQPRWGGRTPHSKRAFFAWSILALLTALAVEYAFIREFGVAKGAGYSAFPQNLLMSILFIAMLATRGSREGQSLNIAVNKWIGTLAATILYGAVGEGGFPRGSFLILTVGIFCSIFDLIYVGLLAKSKPAIPKERYVN